MSSSEQAILRFFSRFALSFDGAFLGAALAYATVRTVIRLTSSCSALNKVREAPYVPVSGLRHILLDEDSGESVSDPKLVIVRGTVEARSSMEGNSKSLQPSVLISQESGDRAVIIQRTQVCIFNEWKGFFGWTSDLRTIFGRSFKKRESTSIRTVPFVLADDHSDYVAVNMNGSRHPLPLTTVYHQLQPVHVTPYTVLQAVFGHEYPIGVLDEEKILPLGKQISAVGICSFENGVPVIKPCNDYPHFLSEMTKDQMITDLVFETKSLFRCSIVLGSLSACILVYSIMRNWNKWKQWRERRRNLGDDSTTSQLDSSNDISNYGDVPTAPVISNYGDVPTAPYEDAVSDDESSLNVPDGQLCVICLARRKRSAFIPCGHFVCCERCAVSVERDSAPKCPLCRQPIRNSVRIYDS